MTSVHPVSRRPVPTSQAAVLRRRSRENEERVLLIQVTWVAAALVVVSTFPSLQVSPLRVSPAGPTPTKLVKNLKAGSRVTDPIPLFTGGSDSVVARTVGHAEGTRTPNGERTPAYYGHPDPGNGVWNLGSFSFQHCGEAPYQCSTPDAADRHQLGRLQAQTQQLHQRASSLNLTLTLEEELNGIDLANQAPQAALGQPGYIEYLAQARKQGQRGQEAILAARLWSYWNPDTQGWDAPGLGNTENGIRRDQQRRMLAIARVLAVYQNPTLATSKSHWQWFNWLWRPTNPYNAKTEQAQALWWDAGYWDARLQQPRHLEEGLEPAYDKGYEQAQ